MMRNGRAMDRKNPYGFIAGDLLQRADYDMIVFRARARLYFMGGARSGGWSK